MFTGYPQTTRLHTTVFPTRVASTKPTSKGLNANLDIFTNVLDTKELVAPRSNKTDALNPKKGMVFVTTFDSPFGPSRTSE